MSTEALSIQSTLQIAKLNLGQHTLLTAITSAVNNRKPLTFDDILDCYCRGVRRIYQREVYNYIDISPNNWRKEFDRYEEFDIKTEYKKNSALWTYTLRPLVKQWFVNNIGTLVIKGKLLVLPVIEID